MATEKEKSLQEELRLQQEIDALNARREQLEQRNTAYSRRRLRDIQTELSQNQELLEVAKQRTREAENIDKKTVSSLTSFARLSGDVKKNLGSLNSQSNIYVNVQRQIIKEEETRAGLSESELEASDARSGFLRDISNDLLTQAKATAKAEQDTRGINEFVQRRNELEQNSLGLNMDQLQLAKDLIDQEEALFKKEQKLLEIKSQQDGLINQMPDSIKQSIGFAKGLGNAIKAGLGPLFLIGAVLALAISSFKELDDAAKEFRDTTGLTNSQMEGIKSDANEIVGQFGNLGVGAKDVFNTVAALKSEFSDTVDFSKETVAALTVMNANFGIAAEDAAKVQGIMEQVGGLSSETAASVGLQAVNMAKAAGVAPAKVMKDIAENAEAASTFFKGDLTALTKNAIQARRMGSSLKEQVALSEKLLDFEGSIEEELVAATFVSGQFNLSRARALAFEGKTAEAAEETLKQIQRSGDFRKKDFFTQQQLAKASGMTVEEINKQLNVQEKLSNLSTEEKEKAEKAIEAGLDITNINKEQLAQETEKFAKQQEQQAQLDKLNNAFMGMAATIGSVLMPLIDAISIALIPVQLAVEGIQWVFGGIGERISALIGPLGMVGKILKGLAGIAIVFAAYKAFASFATVPIVGAIKGGIAAAAILAAGFGMLSKIGDLSSPADGKTIVSTKEGGLFELSPNDDLVAAPGAAAALAGAGVMGSDNGSSNTINVDFSILSAPLNMMINEIKGLRADMVSGKIGVYMDTAKVTSNIGRQVDSSTRNNFNLGQA